MTDAPARPRRRAARRGRTWDAHVILSIAAVVMVFPFLWQLKMSLSTRAETTAIPIDLWPDELRWDNFARVFDIIPFSSQMTVTIVYAIARTLCEIVTCSLAGYAFARMRFRYRRALFAMVLSVLMVPGQIFLIPQYQMMQSLGWLDTMAALLAPGVVSAFGTFFMLQFFKKIPHELSEAAQLDGCSAWQVFWRIIMPLSRPAIVSLAVITVLSAWNNLLWPLVVINDTRRMPVSVGLALLQGDHLTGTDYPMLMAASLMAMAPVFLVFALLQRQVISGFAMTGFK